MYGVLSVHLADLERSRSVAWMPIPMARYSVPHEAGFAATSALEGERRRDQMMRVVKADSALPPVVEGVASSRSVHVPPTVRYLPVLRLVVSRLGALDGFGAACSPLVGASGDVWPGSAGSHSRVQTAALDPFAVCTRPRPVAWGCHPSTACVTVRPVLASHPRTY